jgi:DNA repair protein SbcD/Mre11
MKFAHFADCHIGGWRDPKLKDASITAFCKAMDFCVQHQVDFILISGDLFNTPLPSIDNIKQTVTTFKKVKAKNIPVYLIAGSHDYSPSGKTMLDVLEEAELFVNVCKEQPQQEKNEGEAKEKNTLKLQFTTDSKTGVKLLGLTGKRGMLDKNDYALLDKESLEQEPGKKIFLFHTAIAEFMPNQFAQVQSVPLSHFPKGCMYYAGGHIHMISEHDLTGQGYGTFTYPGPLFPNSMNEVEDIGRGGLYIVEEKEGTCVPQWFPIQLYNTFCFTLDCTRKTAEQIEEDINTQVKDKELYNTLVTMRLKGVMKGKPSDVNFSKVFKHVYDQGAYFVMRSTTKLESDQAQESVFANTEEQDEESLVHAYLNQQNEEDKDINVEQEQGKIVSLIKAFSAEKQEGERVSDFEKRVVSDGDTVLKFKEVE